MKKKSPKELFKGKTRRTVKVGLPDGTTEKLNVEFKDPWPILNRMMRDGLPKEEEGVIKWPRAGRLPWTVGPNQSSIQMAIEQEAARQRFKQCTLGMRYGFDGLADAAKGSGLAFKNFADLEAKIFAQELKGSFSTATNAPQVEDPAPDWDKIMKAAEMLRVDPSTGRDFTGIFWQRRNGKSEFSREYMKQFFNTTVGGDSMGRPNPDPSKLHEIATSIRHDERGMVFDIEIEIGQRSELGPTDRLAVAFGLRFHTCRDIVRMMRGKGLEYGGQDGKPFDEWARAVNNLTENRAELQEVKIMAPDLRYGPVPTLGGMFDAFEKRRDSVAYREIEARYNVYYRGLGMGRITLRFAPHFFNALGGQPEQEEDKTMNKQNEILNLIDESFTTVQVSYDHNHMMGETLEERREYVGDVYDEDDGYTYKVLKTAVGELSVGQYVVVEARGELKVAMITAIHAESCIDDGRRYNWVVDTVRLEGVQRQNERDDKILAEIKQKEKAKQKQELRDHMAERLGIESLADVKALGHVESAEAVADTDQGAKACDVDDGEDFDLAE